MSTLNCRSDKEKISVGEHLVLTCAGNTNSDFALAKSEFKLEENQKYSIKLFSAKAVNQNEFSLDVTIYTPGDFRVSDLTLTDGVNEINLNGPAVKVESVLKPTADGKPPEAFGSILPIGITTPLYYYLFFSVLMLAVAIYTGYRVKRHVYYKKLKEKLAQYSSPVAADTQFYKTIRLAEKADYPLQQVEKAFRLYNLRAYQLPMFDLTNERIAKYFRRNFPEYKNTRLNLNKILGEFEELQKNPHLSLPEKNEFIKKLHRYASIHKGLDQ